jgi:hypothetical protein
VRVLRLLLVSACLFSLLLHAQDQSPVEQAPKPLRIAAKGTWHRYLTEKKVRRPLAWSSNVR